jgi:assimilatory nitrate reductase catalytic subunit
MRSPPGVLPHSKQPELKHAAVKVLKAELPWSLLGVAWLPDERGTGRARGAQAADGGCSRLPAACRFPATAAGRRGAGRERTGVLFRAAAYEAPPTRCWHASKRCWAWTPPTRCAMPTARRASAARCGWRATATRRQHHAGGFVLAGDTSAQAWVKTLLQEELPAQAYGRLLLVPGAKAPVAVQSRGKAGVHLLQRDRPGHRQPPGGLQRHRRRAPGSLQGALKCGTNCGSCVPELKRMVKAVIPLRRRQAA